MKLISCLERQVHVLLGLIQVLHENVAHSHVVVRLRIRVVIQYLGLLISFNCQLVTTQQKSGEFIS